MTRFREVAGGGRLVELDAQRVPGWVTRFADRHGGITGATADTAVVELLGADGETASLAVPFPPLATAPDDGAIAAAAEPLEALLAHMAGLGDLAAIAVRERAFSVGICRDGVVTTSSTDTRYVQSRTAAGGWSQQRYARRRGNQRRDSYRAAADAAARLWAGGHFSGLVAAGDRTAVAEVLADPRLAPVAALPRRVIPDIGEPRRAVLDEVARRALSVEITIRGADATTGT